jgi:hypothetical protein
MAFIIEDPCSLRRVRLVQILLPYLSQFIQHFGAHQLLPWLPTHPVLSFLLTHIQVGVVVPDVIENTLQYMLLIPVLASIFSGQISKES